MDNVLLQIIKIDSQEVDNSVLTIKLELTNVI